MDKNAANESTKDKFSFGITTLLKFTSTLEQVDRFARDFRRCLQQAKYQPPPIEGIPVPYLLPQDWKEKFESWVEPNVYELLKSDHIQNEESFFNELKIRLVKDSNVYDLSMLEWFKKACTDSTIDKQSNEIRSFLKKMYADDGGKLSDIISAQLAIPAPEDVNRLTKDQLIQFINTIRNNSITLSSKVNDHSVDLITSHFLMSIIGQIPHSFSDWKNTNNVCPKDSHYSKLTSYYSVKYSEKPISLKKLGGKKFDEKSSAKISELEKDIISLKAKLAASENTARQLKNKNDGKNNNSPTNNNTPTNPQKRKREPYSGSPCTKCTDPIRAKTHPTEAHKDDYKPKEEFKKLKVSSKK